MWSDNLSVPRQPSLLTCVRVNHEALFYATDEEFADRLTPVLRDAVAAKQAAIAVTTEHRIELLRQRLDRSAPAVSFFDAARWYRSPGAALVNWRDALQRADSLCGIGEVRFEGDADAIRRWTRYESLINRAFAGHPARIICPYNTRDLPNEILADARRTHPVTSTLADRVPNAPHFGERELAAELVPAGTRAKVQQFSSVTVSGSNDLIDVRRSVRWQAYAAGLSADVVDDLLLAVSELLSSAGAASTVRTARANGEWFCEVGSEPSTPDVIPRTADDFAVIIGRIISDRVEVAEHRGGRLVRFVFGRQPADQRQKIISAASELFRANGVRTTGINAVIAHAGVAKATFYAHFRSKDDLIRLWLGSPTTRWFDHVRAEAEARAQTPTGRLIAFFEVLEEWLDTEGFRGCPFINTAIEFRNAANAYTQDLADLTVEIEEYFRQNAREAELADPEGVAQQLLLLVPGTITTATARASAEVARAAKVAASALVASASVPG